MTVSESLIKSPISSLDGSTAKCSAESRHGNRLARGKDAGREDGMGVAWGASDVMVSIRERERERESEREGGRVREREGEGERGRERERER